MYSIAMPNRDKYKVGLVQMSMGTDLDANLKKAVEFVEEAAAKGAPIRELEGVLPAQSRTNIRRMLSELREEGLVELLGSSSAQRWFLRQTPESDA